MAIMKTLTLRWRTSQTAASVTANTAITRIRTLPIEPVDDVPRGALTKPLASRAGALTRVIRRARTCIATTNARVFTVPNTVAGRSSASSFFGGSGRTSG
jgi:hypothetical protein